MIGWIVAGVLAASLAVLGWRAARRVLMLRFIDVQMRMARYIAKAYCAALCPHLSSEGKDKARKMLAELGVTSVGDGL